MIPQYGALAVLVQEVHEPIVHGLAQTAPVLQLFMIGCISASW